jgi:hypothetical protein
MRIIVVMLAAVLLLFTHCKKVELPDNLEGDSVFKLSGELSGDVIDIQAGLDNYVLRASSARDSSGLHQYIGTFEPLECCDQPKVRFVFRGVSRQEALPDSSLKVRNYDFFVPVSNTSETNYKAGFESTFSTSDPFPPYAYEWDFGDGTMSNLANPTHEYEDDTDRMVQLSVTAANGCSAFIEKWISFDSTADISCPVDFTLTPIFQAQAVGVEANLSLSTAGLIYSSWLWNTGDSIDVITLFPLSQTPEEICLTASIDPIGCTSTVCKSVYQNFIQGQFSLGFCTTDFSYTTTVESIDIPAPEQLGTIIIEYEDEDGLLYSTAYGAQSSPHFFNVLLITPFDNNENGKPTVKVDVQFEATLYDMDGSEWNTIQGEATIAVATE